MPAPAVPLSLRSTKRIDVDECDARTLLDYARIALGVDSLYALAAILNLQPNYPQRWYAANNITTVGRELLKLYIAAAENATNSSTSAGACRSA